MSHTPNFDSKIQTILAAIQPGSRTCPASGETWNLTDEELGWYKKFNIPPAVLSPLSRKRILGGFMNGFQWWWQKHPQTGASILSYVHPSSGLQVLPDQEWLAKDFSEINQDYTLDKSFFLQFRELQVKVPLRAANNLIEPEKSMALGSFGDIDSYFVIDGKTKESMFCLFAADTERSVEIHNVLQAIDSYHINDAFNVFKSQYASDLRNLSNSAFAFIASDCTDCFGVAVRKHKSHIFFNEQLTESEYKNKIVGIDLGKRSVAEEWKKKYYDFLSKEIVWPHNMSFGEENCTGEYLVLARDCQYCYACVNRAKNLYHCSFTANEAVDSAYVTSANNIGDCFACVFLSRSSNCRFCYSLRNCQNMEYCFECDNCENCFGCVGLQHKKFHIFNKEYSEAEYWKRVDDLKCTMLERKEYGNFFPLSYSPIYFPQSASALYWLSGEEEAKKLGALVYDPTSADAIGAGKVDTTKARSSNDVPDSIDDIDDSWCGVPIRDESLGRYYTYLKPEVAFYKEHRVAPPNKHFIRRMTDLIHEVNSAVFEDKVCDKCGDKILVSKNLTFPVKKNYCKKCFDQYFEEVS